MRDTARAGDAQADNPHPPPAVLDTRIATHDPAIQKLKHAEIAERYRKRRPFVFESKRVDELERLARRRYGATLPDDKLGRNFVFAVAAHLIEPERIRKWIGWTAPWYPDDEADELIDRIACKRYRFSADKLASAKWLNVSYVEHQALDLITIGAHDMPKKERAALRRELYRPRKRALDRAWRHRQRRAKGVTPRAQYEAESLSRRKPWDAEGISRATWYRRRREISVPVRQVCRSRQLSRIGERHTCLTEQAAPPGGAAMPTREAKTLSKRRPRGVGEAELGSRPGPSLLGIGAAMPEGVLADGDHAWQTMELCQRGTS
jgi:hypothetical protein